MTDYRYIVIMSKIYRVWGNIGNTIDEYICMCYICVMGELNYIDDDCVAELIEEARLYHGIEVDTSWYKGAGWYDWYFHKVSGEA